MQFHFYKKPFHKTNKNKNRYYKMFNNNLGNLTNTNLNSISFYQSVVDNIKNSKTYISFFQWIRGLSTNKLKGDAQEIFSKIYFLSHRTHYNIKAYYSHLLDVIPKNLSVNVKDLGSDAIIIHNDGKISLVQVKFRSNFNSTLKKQ